MRVPTLPTLPDLPTAAGRAAHEIGLAGLLGGNLFGRLALHPAVENISDKSERGKVINAAWRRYGTVNSVSLLLVTGGWVAARLGETRDNRLSPRERTLARTKDGLVAAVTLTGLATAAEGVRFARQAPDGAVPMETGSEPAAETPASAARSKRILNVLGATGAVTEMALVAVNAGLAQENFRRPPARRTLRRRSR
ncbi:MAG: hypothetical protein M3Z33_06395 [Actinomycetota bacterium]|nr:hypothetical protein [Actinomycetota bacterium]